MLTWYPLFLWATVLNRNVDRKRSHHMKSFEQIAEHQRTILGKGFGKIDGLCNLPL